MSIALPALRRASLACLLASAVAGLGSAESVVLVADRDNTLIEDELPLSLGLAYDIFTGRVGANGGGTRRRGLLRFDVADAVPPGATVTSAVLRLYMSQGNGTQNTAIKRLLADWGEGDSFAFGGAGAPAEPGDATWVHTFFPGQSWATPGGDFVAVASATRLVGGPGFYTWGSSAAMVADVQGWLDAPASNFGWLVQGNEAAQQTAKKFASRQSPNASLRPTLTVEFTPPPVCLPADLDCDGAVDGADLGLLLAGWGAPGPADLDGSGTVDGGDLGLLLAAWTR
ncbi:MAG TPA: DNRLRE domain-containing protein [Phycisphaerales bacterium]|nr:DNRLRE domain-containing protein [Phycisphaerales bacterium]